MLGMPKNNPAEGLEKMVSDWVSQLGDRIGAERMTEAVSGAIAGVSRTRKTVDRNFNALLSIANIPSRSEYDRMQQRLSAIQNSIRNLSRRLDDLNSQIAEDAKPKARKSKPKAAKSKAGRTLRAAAGARAKRAKPKAKSASAARGGKRKSGR